mmetsp:Transcript_9639/g.38984  ORF Transcript_9639/g.38984 Transcript_9639/m.38984 type:complete len:393 (-) Transcript_9639:1749-2927(-)
MVSRASSNAASSCVASRPPACANPGLPPPPPPHAFAAAPSTAPALSPPALCTSSSKMATKPTLPSALPLPSTTAAPASPASPASFASKLSAADLSAAGSTPSSLATSTLDPFDATIASAASAADLAAATSPRSASASFCAALRSSISDVTRPAISSGGTRRAPASSRTTPSRWLRSSTTPGPETASMRRTPAAMPASETILNPPISAVLATWVPPQSSMDTPGTSTTRTTSPYFSPNMAVAPRLLASAMGISRATRSVASPIQPLTSASISSSCAGVGPAGALKSKRSLSVLTREPACETSSPTTLLSADWRRCVAVWFALARRRDSAFTAAVTASPTDTDGLFPELESPTTSQTWTKTRPPAAFRQSRTERTTPFASWISPSSPTCPPPSA